MGKLRRPSIADVAKLAGVSVTTASRVISGADYPVSTESRSKVLEAAKMLDFVPDLAARSLVRGRSSLVGVLVHDISDPYYSEIVSGIEDVVQKHDMVVMVVTTHRQPDKEIKAIQTLHAHRVDGIILAGGGLNIPDYVTRLNAQIATLNRHGIPVVSTGPQVLALPTVTIDNAAVTACMVSHLTQLGHTRILYLAGPRELLTSHHRLEGVRTSLNRNGIPLDPDLIIWEDFSFAGGRRGVESALKDGITFTGVFAANDRMAAGAQSALRAAGLRVPHDVSVAGLDDVEVASVMDPPLTTIRLPMRAMGQEGARLLYRILESGSNEPCSITMPFELMIRQSTAAINHGGGKR